LECGKDKIDPNKPLNIEPNRRPILDFFHIFRFIAPVPRLLFSKS
jgi:hypothetical protein